MMKIPNKYLLSDILTMSGNLIDWCSFCNDIVYIKNKRGCNFTCYHCGNLTINFNKFSIEKCCECYSCEFLNKKRPRRFICRPC